MPVSVYKPSLAYSKAYREVVVIYDSDVLTVDLQTTSQP